jgi:hypothetical protein
MAKEQDTKAVLDKIDPEKREFIGKLVTTTAFVAPLVASFAMDNMTVGAAAASNLSLA